MGAPGGFVEHGGHNTAVHHPRIALEVFRQSDLGVDFSAAGLEEFQLQTERIGDAANEAVARIGLAGWHSGFTPSLNRQEIAVRLVFRPGLVLAQRTGRMIGWRSGVIILSRFRLAGRCSWLGQLTGIFGFC
jgi:hypothetical protein